REEMLVDLEDSLVTHLESQLTLPGLSKIPLKQNANPGDTQVVVSINKAFHINNMVTIVQGGAVQEKHNVANVVHDDVQKTTTLSFGSADKVVNALTAGTALVSVAVPVVVETPPLPTNVPNPAVVITFRDIREDLERTAYISQQDSFRLR